MNKLKCTKFAVGIEYDGSCYHGWQSQKLGISSVQSEVEQAISIVADHKVHVVCSGRTDSKVHSIGQVIHFKTFAIRKNIDWLLGINNCLPKNITIQWIKEVSNIFHARHSAVSRCYRYIIYNHMLPSAILYNRVNYIRSMLNIQDMFQASQCIIGEHDFTSFRSVQCQSHTPFRKITYINIFKMNKFIFIDIEANSFLQHMVRNIIGCLIEIGKMKKHFTWIIYVLNKKNRQFCGPTANPSGLYLFTVKYPSNFNLPINYF